MILSHMQSMTGYGSAEGRGKKWAFSVQLKSINSRFFDIKLHVPGALSGLEPEMRALVSNKFSRGTLDIYVKAEMVGLGVSKLPQINEGLLEHYQSSILKAAKKIKPKPSGDISWSDLLKLPEVIRFESQGELPAEEKKALVKIFTQALKTCEDERNREGQRLAKDLKKLLVEMQGNLKKIKTLQDKVNGQMPAAQVERIRVSLEKKGLELNETRLNEEWAYYRERSAIFEEVERLTVHLGHCLNLLAKSDQPVGKRLDFYTQELLREFNTIGSKTNSAEVTQLVVESKNLIERLREQVQNIE